MKQSQDRPEIDLENYEMKQFFSTKEAAKYLALSVASIYYHLYQARDLKGQMWGNSLMFTKDQLDYFQDNKRSSGRPKASSG